MQSNKNGHQEKKEAETAMKKTLKIKGMMCNHCVMHVTKALEGVSGVAKAEVSLKDNQAVVTLKENVSDTDLTNAVKEAGYEVTAIE